MIKTLTKIGLSPACALYSFTKSIKVNPREIAALIVVIFFFFNFLIPSLALAQPVAFPGAEGFGKFASGGRGGKVIYVTNLNDKGPGSLREAVTAGFPRIVLFSVSGTIHLASPLIINQDNITIAGQSAPGDGIAIADHPVGIAANNVILRFLRFRMGDRFQNQGMVHGAGADDALSSGRKRNLIIDHCSLSWSTDEVFSVYAGDSTTLQWNLIAEPLDYSYHFEKGDTDFEHHGFGGIWGGKHLSAHHNLFAHCTSRTPRFDGIRNAPSEFVDFRNNVLYNWKSNNVYGGEGGQYNIVDNYYKYGPETNSSVRFQILNPFKLDGRIPFGKYFVSGNFVDGSDNVTKDNWLGVKMEKGTDADKLNSKITSAFPAVEIASQSAKDAYKSVLLSVGAVFPRRDEVDERILKEVETRTGKIIDVQGGYPHGTPYEQTKGAWPQLRASAAPTDSDEDGIPDAWEVSHKLNPKNALDGNSFGLDKNYSNVEVYLNSLVQRQAIKPKQTQKKRKS
ncbi:polysaccharide lyase family 1 protein [Pedobacter sp. SYSU D00535]|uniref:pectate lyase family protein n=1 Tax=Pedobacter sp. SYSU D00535 TaxID=2810308 RepID=UPI001F621133|nr:pectate lyase [Pedobacter sp. SYSU D00535]